MSIAFDKAANTGNSTSTTLAITPSNAGNAIFVVIFSGGSGALGVTDNVNTGAYTSVGTLVENTSSGTYAQWFYHLNCAASVTTLTVTGGTNPGMIAYSLSGVAATSVIADNESGTGTTTALSTTSLSASTPGGMLLAAWGDGFSASVTPFISSTGLWSTSANENMDYTPAGAQHQALTTSGVQVVTATALEATTTWVGVSVSINPVPIYFLCHL
jgi:hypothetical protein